MSSRKRDKLNAARERELARMQALEAKRQTKLQREREKAERESLR